VGAERSVPLKLRKEKDVATIERVGIGKRDIYSGKKRQKFTTAPEKNSARSRQNIVFTGKGEIGGVINFPKLKPISRDLTFAHQ